MHKSLSVFLSCCALGLAACENNIQTAKQDSIAPGSPGAEPVWAYAGKVGIGSSYETYSDGRFSDNNPLTGKVSRVWFSLADGGLTEVMYGLIHQAQLKDMQLIVMGEDFVDVDIRDTEFSIEYLARDASDRPLAPAFKIINKDRENKYQIEKHYFTDPSRQSLFMRVTLHSNEKLSLYASFNPHMNNDGWGDRAWHNELGLHSEDAGNYMSVSAIEPFAYASVGFKNRSDLATDLSDGNIDWQYTDTGESRGNVVMAAKLFDVNAGDNKTIDLAMGFGHSNVESSQAARASLQRGYQAVLDEYLGNGEHIGWQDYLQSLPALSDLQKVATDSGKLVNASALVLKVQEDKTHAGALIASLSNPWGDTVSAAKGATGYKAVWPRDFYQCAMAFLALGDTETPRVAFEYLQQVQVNENTPGNNGDGGWFLQKTHVDGTPEWVAVQLDQTAMPIMLGWQLFQQGVLSESDIKQWYAGMLKPAADFLVNGGKLELGWAEPNLIPPHTQQERWEEQQGYSPSTMAAVIAGLVTAADIATFADDTQSAELYLNTADQYSGQLEQLTFTNKGVFADGHYYLRIAPQGQPNSPAALEDRNGRGPLNALEILDGGFLELVRYGVRPADFPAITKSLAVLNDESLPDTLRVKYSFNFPGEQGSFPGWRRYGHDGYGEDKKNGLGYGAGSGEGGMSPNQRGRVWPFFTGEQAHYQLAAGTAKETIRSRYVRAMELFANQGLMLPEQVWDGVGVNPGNRYQVGEGTNGATPLAWTHAEYVKLLRSLNDGKVWDYYPVVGERYARQN